MTNESIPVNCGKCPSCIKRRTSQWSFRLRKEALRSISAHFVTLTYDTENVPLTKRGYMTLNTRDMELFFKKLRKQEDKRGVKIKYFYVGEYGGKTNRPHYHAIIYNADVNNIDKTWDKGQTHFGEVNGASIGYSLKYIMLS